MPKKPPPKDTPKDFESALGELEQVVARLERGDQPLEEALKDFERGIALARQCQERLKEAEQRVEILLEKDGELRAQPFSPED